MTAIGIPEELARRSPTHRLHAGNSTSCAFPSDAFHAEYFGVDLSSFTKEDTNSTKMRAGDTYRHMICQYGPGLCPVIS